MVIQDIVQLGITLTDTILRLLSAVHSSGAPN